MPDIIWEKISIKIKSSFNQVSFIVKTVQFIQWTKTFSGIFMDQNMEGFLSGCL